MSSRAPSTTIGIVVMGVSGSGKSTIATLLATRLGWEMAEADQFHPQSNIEKMTSGSPLTDADRFPWLHAIRKWIDVRTVTGNNVILTCSALKRSYRDVLRQADTDVRFVHLTGSVDVLGERVQHRSGHFMPSTLLQSQLNDLEPLGPNEDGVSLDVTGTPDDLADAALTQLGLAPE